MSTQDGDVNLIHQPDGGNILVENGVAEMAGGLGNAVYLSLFGGNDDDSGGANRTNSWWANLDELRPDRRYVSELQYLTGSIPALPVNLRRIEDAAYRDLQWIISAGIAASVVVSASIPSLNVVTLGITIRTNGDDINFEFTENWEAM